MLVELVIAFVMFILNDAFASSSKSGRLANITVQAKGNALMRPLRPRQRRQRLLRIRRRFRMFLRLGLAPGGAGRPAYWLRARRAPRVLPLKSVNCLRAVLCGEVGDNVLPPRCIVLACYPL
ncbi:hypothetical protein PF008_g32003 [Phytophthora fragariae]|uniref:Secreted protein n=1 Tax=Phytophthora fragariae TaxID=53985 RepID=A0A6G0Q136_9STRA|nr:hypothetical protein PF008_g32003 [Phytophthora fragariae]